MKISKILILSAAALSLAACGEHTHSFGEAWKSDDSSHWHECECGEKSEKADHLDANTDGNCDVCNYQMLGEVTADEWVAAFTLSKPFRFADNFKIDGTNTVEGQTSIAEIIVDGLKLKANETIDGNVETIYTEISGDSKYTYEYDTETKKWSKNSVTSTVADQFAQLFLPFAEYYSSFTYNSESKSYTCSSLTYKGQVFTNVEIKFENKRIKGTKFDGQQRGNPLTMAFTLTYGGQTVTLPEVQGSVSNVTVSCDPTVVAGKTITAIANVTATGDASENVAWSSSDTTVARVDSNGVITGLKAGKVTITATSRFDTSKFADVQVVVVAGEWPNEVKELMQEYFATVLPYFEGNFVWTEEEDNILCARSDEISDMQKIVEAYDRLEIEKAIEGNDVLYTLPYSLDDRKCIVINVCVEEEKATFMAVVSYLRYTKWETEKIAELVHSLDEETTTVIPEAPSVHFLFFNENYSSDEIHGLVTVPEMNASGDYYNPTEEYVGILSDLGWFIKEGGTQFSTTTHICVSPDKKIVLELSFRSPYFYIHIYANTLSFPFDEMKAVMTALGSTDDPVAPEGFELDKFYTKDSEWDSKGIYLIYVYNGIDLNGVKSSFEEAWVSAGWTLVTLSNYSHFDSAAVSPDGKVCIEYGFNNNKYFNMYYHTYTESLS